MTTTISYGTHATCELSLGDHTLLAPDAAEHPSLRDPAAAVRAALTAPRDYPPLAAALAPGDHVTIAVGRGVPQLDQVLRGAIAELIDAGVEPANVTVLSAEPLNGLGVSLVEHGIEGVTLVVHNPDDEDAIAMLGMTAAMHPLRLNRLLTEADVVLPIATARAAGRDSAPEKFAGLFPRFSNRATIDRIQGRGKSAAPLAKGKPMAESEEAGWLPGVGMEVIVVPGPAGGVAAVFSGDPGAATKAAAAEFAAIWERSIDQRGDLVIGSVTGDAQQQTWGNLARAVSACSRVARADAAIAVCCELDEPPAGSYEALVDAFDLAKVSAHLRKSAAADARPALVLAQALERGPLYLRSDLPAEVVESLGMTPIADDAELERLARGRRHCIVIEEAQRVKPRLVGDSNDME